VTSENAIVTRLEFDPDRYQSFLYDLPSDETEIDLWMFNGASRSATWTPMPIYSQSPRLQQPDIWQLVGAAVLVFSEEVAQALEPFVSIAGEQLPLRVSDGDTLMYALNILKDVDCLDKSSSDFEDPSLRRLTFIEHRLPESGLFKVPEYETVDIFHVERAGDRDSFRRRVEQHELEGVSFRTVWASDRGMVPVDLFPF
jgi:hypothetical protein